MESETGKRLFKRLREVRKTLGLSQTRFAELIGFGYKYYQQLELGNKTDPQLSTLERIAGALGVEVCQLLNFEIPVATLAEAPAKYLTRRRRPPPKK